MIARLLFVLIFLPRLAQAQNSFADDSLLKRLTDSLPVGWTMMMNDSELVISRHDSVWERPDTMSARGDVRNYFPSSEEEKEQLELFKKEGRRVISRITYRLEPKWGPWTMAMAMASAWYNNDTVEKKISKLQTKYKIDRLYRRTRYGEEFSAKTDDEKERVQKYWLERKALEAHLINYPEHNSTKYSLFEKSVTGFDNRFTRIWPIQAAIECSEIRILLNELRRMVFR